jgi:hypothetical protein
LFEAGLLQAAFAKAALAQGYEATHPRARLTLADRQQLGGGGQLAVQVLQALPKLVGGGGQGLISHGVRRRWCGFERMISDEGLLKELAPAGMFFRSFAAAAVEILFGQVAGIHLGDHLKLRPSGLQGHHKKDALGIKGGVEITTLACRRHPVQQAESGVVQVALSAHVLPLSAAI